MNQTCTYTSGPVGTTYLISTQRLDFGLGVGLCCFVPLSRIFRLHGRCCLKINVSVIQKIISYLSTSLTQGQRKKRHLMGIKF